MKHLLLALTTCLLSVTLITCQSSKKEDPKPATLSLPNSMNIKLPTAVSGIPRNLRREAGRSEADTVINGNAIYEGLRGYIKVGDESGQLITELINIIKKYNLTQDLDLTYVDNDDKRTKRIKVTKSATYDGVSYEYKIFFRDSSLRLTALELFFNASPVKGVAILSFNALNPKDVVAGFNPMVRIDYSEAPGGGYEKMMDVLVSGVITTSGLSALRLTVKQQGDILHIYGNSNHPKVMTGELDLGSLSYAFRAKVNTKLNIACAEVALPPSSLETINNTALNTFSVKEVLKGAAVVKWGAGIAPFVDRYLKNTNPPGYFDKDGFVSAGSTTLSGYANLENLSNLVPYAPKSIADLKVEFSK